MLIVPVAVAPRFTMRVRLGPTRNNQAKGVRFAEHFTVERWVERLGRAQAA